MTAAWASCSDAKVTYQAFSVASQGVADLGTTVSVVKADMTTSVAISVGMSLTMRVVRLVFWVFTFIFMFAFMLVFILVLVMLALGITLTLDRMSLEEAMESGEAVRTVEMTLEIDPDPALTCLKEIGAGM